MKTQIVISNAQAVTDEWIKNDLSQIVTGPFNHQQSPILTFFPNE
jgi:hypothetical protein